MIDITPSAIAKLKDYADQSGCNYIVRAKVVGGSCAGLKGDLLLEEIVSDDDITFEQDGVKFVIDQISQHYLDGASIGYVDDGFVAGFKFLFRDGRVKSCGCGSSFGYE